MLPVESSQRLYLCLKPHPMSWQYDGGMRVLDRRFFVVQSEQVLPVGQLLGLKWRQR